MTTNHWQMLGATIAATVFSALPLCAQAGKPGGSSTATRLNAYVYSSFQDQQDTNTFNYGTPVGDMCDGKIDLPWDQETANFGPDELLTNGTGAWSFVGSPWSATTSDPFVTYADGADCLSKGNCMRAQLMSSDRILTIDTTYTTGPRTFKMDLGYRFNPDDVDWSKPIEPQGSSPLGDRVVSAKGLFEVLGSTSSLKDMKVCTSRACEEGRQDMYARYWFVDAGGTTWRLDWNFTRVLRVSGDTWYFIAGACDGSRTAGLSKLTGNRTRPRETNEGWYLMPFFIAVQLK